MIPNGIQEGDKNYFFDPFDLKNMCNAHTKLAHIN